MNKTNYSPLPGGVVVRISPIHGYGLFATEHIAGGTDLGVSHIFAPGFKDNHVRTPLGGFINHSDEPNCFKLKSPDQSVLTYYNLYTTRDVESGEELTVWYTLYNIKKSFKVAKSGECPIVDDNTTREELDNWRKQKANI